MTSEMFVGISKKNHDFMPKTGEKMRVRRWMRTSKALVEGEQGVAGG